jgi:hypothetical protein
MLGGIPTVIDADVVYNRNNDMHKVWAKTVENSSCIVILDNQGSVFIWRGQKLP